MTQPEVAVGGEPTAPEPTLEDRMAAAVEPEQQEEEELTEEAPEAEAEPAEIAEDEIEVEAEDVPPIDPPISWTAEEKAKFAAMPRDLQETVQKREAEREKFVQSKAQEAAQAQREAVAEATRYAAQLRSEAAAQLDQYAAQFVVSEPDPALIATDPALYAQQARAHQYWTAQREQAQRDAEQARAEAQRYEAALQQHETQAFRQRLSEELPEFFDETAGPKLKEQLTATAKFLGFSDEQIFSADAEQIIALKSISELKAKADKFDNLMAKQMERVRQGKKLTPVAKPGVAQGPNAMRDNQYRSDRQAMKGGDRDAAVRVFSKFL